MSLTDKAEMNEVEFDENNQTWEEQWYQMMAPIYEDIWNSMNPTSEDYRTFVGPVY